MRLKKYIIFCLYLLLTGLYSCEKWLDVNPKSRISERIMLEDEQGFKDALIGVYTQLASRDLYAKEFSMGVMDVLAMNYNVSNNNNTYHRVGQYNYKDPFVQQKIDAFWSEGFKAIANINNILENIDQKQSVFSGNNYRQIKGEALALRALVHFDLLRSFGPIPALGLDKPGIPYVKTFDMEIKPILSAKTVLTECLADLKEGRDLLSINKSVVNGHSDIFLAFTRNHLNYWATTGLTARINLYQGDKAAAYDYANEVIASGLFPFITPEAATDPASPNRVFSTEHLFCLYVSNLTDINAELFRYKLYDDYLTATDAQINELFEISNGGSTDYRYLTQWKTEGSSAVKFPAKYWQDNIVWDNIRNRVPILKISEMYYIAAESSALRSEKTQLLNTVRRNRGLNLLPDDMTASQLDDEIFKEYRKDFYQEGQLFYYYKRLNKPMIEGYPSPVGQAIYVLPFPNDEIEFNPSLNQNK